MLNQLSVYKTNHHNCLCKFLQRQLWWFKFVNIFHDVNKWKVLIHMNAHDLWLSQESYYLLIALLESK